MMAAASDASEGGSEVERRKLVTSQLRSSFIGSAISDIQHHDDRYNLIGPLVLFRLQWYLQRSSYSGLVY